MAFRRQLTGVYVLVNKTYANSTLTYKQLNCAISKWLRQPNGRSIYRNTTQNRKVVVGLCLLLQYYLLLDRTCLDLMRMNLLLWSNRGATVVLVDKAEVYHSVPIDKDTTTPDGKKAHHFRPLSRLVWRKHTRSFKTNEDSDSTRELTSLHS
jgi:hypothetical protein